MAKSEEKTSIADYPSVVNSQFFTGFHEAIYFSFKKITRNQTHEIWQEENVQVKGTKHHTGRNGNCKHSLLVLTHRFPLWTCYNTITTPFEVEICLKSKVENVVCATLDSCFLFVIVKIYKYMHRSHWVSSSLQKSLRFLHLLCKKISEIYRHFSTTDKLHATAFVYIITNIVSNMHHFIIFTIRKNYKKYFIVKNHNILCFINKNIFKQTF